MNILKITIYTIISLTIIISLYLLYKYFYKNNKTNDYIKLDDNSNINIIENNTTNIDNNNNNDIIDNKLPLIIKEKNNVFFDISINNIPQGKIIIELFDNEVPKTCMNFRYLCMHNLLNSNNKTPSYQGCIFHRVIKDFMIQSGDFINMDGTGGSSIYGDSFEDENFDLLHNQPGLLSMANKGPDTNSSQFFILTKEAPWLDNKHVVFGIILSGFNIVQNIENIDVDENDKPLYKCEITNCGLIV